VIEKEYSSDQEKDHLSCDDSDEAPQLITSREDFETLVDEFLTNYEILGGKIKPKLQGDDEVEKLDTLRRAMGDDLVNTGDDESEGEGERFVMKDEEDKQDRWDCETILSTSIFTCLICLLISHEATYSNLENHPRLIRARDDKLAPKIRLDPVTGLPSAAAPIRTSKCVVATDGVSECGDLRKFPTHSFQVLDLLLPQLLEELSLVLEMNPKMKRVLEKKL